MSVLLFLGIAFGGAAATLLTRRWAAVSATLGIAALIAGIVAAAAIRPETVQIGGGTLVGTAYGRLFLVLGLGSGLVLSLMGLANGLPRNLPGAVLGGLGGAGLALFLPDPTTAVVATIVSGLAGVLVTLRYVPTAIGVAAAARELRAIVVAGGIVLLATAWVSRPLDTLAADPPVFGLAYLAVAVGVAMRFGAVPFHLWVARVADAAPEVALPLITAWGPAALAVVGLAWVDASIVPVSPIAGDLPAERIVIIAIGLACLVLAAIAAWIQVDLEHVVAYATIQDAGIVVLSFAALELEQASDTGTWPAARTWIIVMLVTRTAFAAWAVATRARFGTRRIDELRGWARRSPVLAIGLLAIAVASIGWPGFGAFDARATIIRLAIGGPFQAIALAAVFLPLLYYGRLFAVGLAAPTAAIRDVADDRPRVPLDPATGVRFGRGNLPPLRERGAWPAVGRLVLDANRGLVVAALAFVLAAGAIFAAGGSFGLPAAAAEAAPAPSGVQPDLAAPGSSPDLSTPEPTAGVDGGGPTEPAGSSGPTGPSATP